MVALKIDPFYDAAASRKKSDHELTRLYLAGVNETFYDQNITVKNAFVSKRITGDGDGPNLFKITYPLRPEDKLGSRVVEYLNGRACAYLAEMLNLDRLSVPPVF